MKKAVAFALVSAALGFSGLAGASEAECEAKYGARAKSPAEAVASAECFLALPVNEFRAERAAIALSWAIRKGEAKADRAAWIARGLASAEAWIVGGLASGTYWRSVFRTFEANLKDEGLRLPVAMLRALPLIRKDLRDAVKARPETHFYGPSRVQGVVDLSAPAIAGGDPERAFGHFTDALAGSPTNTLNRLWYAKALMRLRRETEGKEVLRAIVAIDPAVLDPSIRPEAEEDRAEAAKLLAEAP